MTISDGPWWKRSDVPGTSKAANSDDKDRKDGDNRDTDKKDM